MGRPEQSDASKPRKNRPSTRLRVTMSNGEVIERSHTILFYSKSTQRIWHPVYTAHDPAYVKRQYFHTTHIFITLTDLKNYLDITNQRG